MKKRKIIVNKARCKKCGDIIESKSKHDLVTCSCGTISVDGGHNCLIRYVPNAEDDFFEDLSEYADATIADAVRQFVELSGDKYSIYENYSGRCMFGRKCLGVVVRNGYSYMEMLINLTRYLDENNLADKNFELEGVSVDDLGLDTIVYFPNMEG